MPEAAAGLCPGLPLAGTALAAESTEGHTDVSMAVPSAPLVTDTGADVSTMQAATRAQREENATSATEPIEQPMDASVALASVPAEPKESATDAAESIEQPTDISMPLPVAAPVANTEVDVNTRGNAGTAGSEEASNAMEGISAGETQGENAAETTDQPIVSSVPLVTTAEGEVSSTTEGISVAPLGVGEMQRENATDTAETNEQPMDTPAAEPLAPRVTDTEVDASTRQTVATAGPEKVTSTTENIAEEKKRKAAEERTDFATKRPVQDASKDARIPATKKDNATVKFALLFDNDDGSAKRFELRATETVRVGRHPKNEIVLTPLTISNLHLEFRFLQGSGAPKLGMCDLSANGTGVQAPGAAVSRLTKNVNVTVRDGSMVVVPMRQATEPTCFFVHLGTGPVPATAQQRLRDFRASQQAVHHAENRSRGNTEGRMATQTGKEARTANREMHKAQRQPHTVSDKMKTLSPTSAASRKPEPPYLPSTKDTKTKQAYQPTSPSPSEGRRCNNQKDAAQLDQPVLPLNSRSPAKRAEKLKKGKKDARGRSKSPTKKRRRKRSSSTGSRSCANYSPPVKRKKGITRRSLSCSTSVDRRQKKRSCSRMRSRSRQRNCSISRRKSPLPKRLKHRSFSISKRKKDRSRSRHKNHSRHRNRNSN